MALGRCGRPSPGVSSHRCSVDTRGCTAALRGYIEEMREWVAAVRAGESVDNVIPVNAPATLQNADALCSRLDHMERELIPEFEHDTHM